MVNLLKQFDSGPPGRGQAESAETLERLRSLGYIGGGSATAKERYTEADDPKRLIELEQMMKRAAEAFARAIGRRGHRSLLARSFARRSDTEDAYRKLALVLLAHGRPREAVATLESALRAGVTQSEVLIKLGQYLAESGQPAKAIALLERHPGDDPDALIVLGNAYAMAGRLPEARRVFTRVLAQNPDDAVAHENLGVVQLQIARRGGGRALSEARNRARSAPGGRPHRARCLAGLDRPQGRSHRHVDPRPRTRSVRRERPPQPEGNPLTCATSWRQRLKVQRIRSEKSLERSPECLPKPKSATWSSCRRSTTLGMRRISMSLEPDISPT